MSRCDRWLAALVLAAGLFWGLGTRGLLEPDEGRTAGKAVEMMRAGAWLEPRLAGLRSFDKPPLTYWACIAAYRVLGANEWAARLPAALAALGTLLLTAALARRLAGDAARLPAAAVLLTSPLFFGLAHLIDPNMLLTFWTTLAFWAAAAWIQDGRPAQRWMFYLALGLGFLTKGPPAWMIVLVGLAGYRWWPAAGRAWRPLAHVPGILAALALGLSWYVAVALRHAELWGFFLGDEIVGRVATGVHRRSEPFFYYLAVLPAGMLTWLPALLAGLGRAWRERRTDVLARLALAGILGPLAVFSCVSSKLPTYLLPLYPLAALLAGRELALRWERAGFRRLTLLWAAAIPVIAALLLARHGVRRYEWAQAFAPGEAAALVVAMAAAALLALRRAPLVRPVWAAVPPLIGLLAVLAMVARNDTRLAGKSSARGAGRALAAAARPGDRIALYRNYPRGLPFYVAQPLTVPVVTDKFEIQIPEDRSRLGVWAYDDAEKDDRIADWFTREPRVFLVTTDRADPLTKRSPLEILRKKSPRPVRELHRDGKLVVVTNTEP